MFVNSCMRIFFIAIFIFSEIILFNTIAKGDIYYDLDLLPIDKNTSIIKVKYNNSFSMMSKKLENLNSFRSSKNIFNKSSVGFSFGKNNNLFYDIDFTNNNIKSNFKPQNYQQENFKTKITIVYPSNNFGDTETIKGLSFRLGTENQNRFLCVENEQSVYGIKNNDCNVSGKAFYQYEDDTNGYIFSYKRKIFGVDAFYKKVDYTWLGKILYHLKIKSSLVQNNSNINKLLATQHPEVKNILPQTQDWINITFNPNYSITRQLRSGWSFGNSYDLYMINSINYIQNKKLPKFNSKIEAKITKKLNDNIFVSFGGFYSNNYKVGIDDLSLNNINSDLYNKSYSEIFLSFGTILNQSNSQSVSEDKDIISLINNEISKEKNYMIFHFAIKII